MAGQGLQMTFPVTFGVVEDDVEVNAIEVDHPEYHEQGIIKPRTGDME